MNGLRLLAFLGFSISLAACGGKVIFDGTGAGGGGGDGGTTTSTSTGTTTTGTVTTPTTTAFGCDFKGICEEPEDPEGSCSQCALAGPCAPALDGCFNDQGCSAFVD